MGQFKNQVSHTLLCQWLDLPRSVSYYQPQPGRPGARPSQATMKLDGSWVGNQLVVSSIRQLLEVEFNALGYEYITYDRTDFYDSCNCRSIKIFIFFSAMNTGKNAMNQLIANVINDQHFIFTFARFTDIVLF